MPMPPPRKKRTIYAILSALLIVFLGVFDFSIPYRVHLDRQVLAIEAMPLRKLLNVHAGDRNWLFIGGQRIHYPRSRSFPFFLDIKDTPLIIYGTKSYLLCVFDRQTKKTLSFEIGTSSLGLLFNGGVNQEDVWLTNASQVVVRSRLEPVQTAVLDLKSGTISMSVANGKPLDSR